MYDLETKCCVGCGISFKVLAASPQKYHSAQCQRFYEGGSSWAAPSKALKKEKHNREKERVSGTKTLSTEPSILQPKKSNELITRTEKMSEVNDTITHTKRKLMPSELSEKEETSNSPEPTTESITGVIVSPSSDKYWKPDVKGSRTEDLPLPYEGLKTEHLNTMSLLNSSMLQLKTVLDSVATANNENPMRTLGACAIDDICKVANTISVMAKVKVDAVRAVTDVIRASKD